MKTRAIILGAGYRGRAFAQYALAFPERLEIVAVADCLNPEAIPATLSFDDWKDALDAKVPADLVIVTLPDECHYEAVIAALKGGYHVLCEKPLGRNRRECDEIHSVAEKAGKLLMIGYELRYSRYFSRIKAALAMGAIGDVATIAHQESIGYHKAAHSFVRGGLSRAEKSTPLLISKCSHDLDLFLWWLEGKKVLRATSYGSLRYFRPENAPQGSTEFCRDCPHIDTCAWSAKKHYLESNELSYLFFDSSRESMEKVAWGEPYGRCVFRSDNDVADRQVVMMEFEGGTIATLTISAFTLENVRQTLITGTLGELRANGDTIEIRRFDGEKVELPDIIASNDSRHDGGDFNLMTETLRLIGEGSREEFAAILTEALRSHYLAFEIESCRE